MRVLNETFKLPYIDELVRRKLAGPEHATLDDADMPFHEFEYARLRAELQQGFEQSALPEAPTARDELNDLLLSLRLGD